MLKEVESLKEKVGHTLSFHKDMRLQQVIYLPQELLYVILLRLPVEDLCKLQFVCKEWYNLINSSMFIRAHISRSKTVLISMKIVRKKTTEGPTVESALQLPPSYRYYFHFLQLHDGKNKLTELKGGSLIDILATCDGLVLATCAEKERLVVMNPSTGNYAAIPSGTIGFCSESYGLISSSVPREYKVVHIFLEKAGYVTCEILSLSTRSWKAVEGLPSDPTSTSITKQKPVSAGSSLCWLPHINGIGYVILLDAHSEKFLTKPLPLSSTLNDKLVEIGGCLGFLTPATLHRLQVWILKNASVEEEWVKRYSINVFYIVRSLIPLCSSQDGKIMFFTDLRGSSLQAYNFEDESMKEVNVDGESEPVGVHSYLPHVKSLISLRGA